MSGHNKWSKIHRQKSAADNKRGAVFTKIGNAITMAAKTGGADPATNFKLQLAIDQAKSVNMPKDNIERAIKRGTGELASGALEYVAYEGYGPEGTAFLVEALTDNRNRTSSSMKHIFSKYGGNLGTPNSVSWMFEARGIIFINKISEELELELIDAGATEITEEEDGITIFTEPASLEKIKKILEQKNIKIQFAEQQMTPKEKKKVMQSGAEKVNKLYDELDNDEDVNNIYTNADF